MGYDMVLSMWLVMVISISQNHLNAELFCPPFIYFLHFPFLPPLLLTGKITAIGDCGELRELRPDEKLSWEVKQCVNGHWSVHKS